MFSTAVALLVFPGAMAFAAATDLFTMRISNRVSLALVAGFALAAVLSGLPLAEIGLHVAAGAAMLAVCFGFFAAGWMGGGDAKLAAATALWLGWSQLLEYALLASIIGGALTVALIIVRTLPLPAPLLGQAWAMRLHDRTAGVPYGIALAASGLLVYPQSLWMNALAQ